VDALRAQMDKDIHIGTNAAQRLAPAAGVWAREMLFLLRLSIRAFLTGYSEGKAEAETRDWTGIQKKIFEDAGVSMDDADGATAAAAAAAAAARARESKPAKASRATVVADAKASGVSATLDGIEFIRKSKKRPPAEGESDVLKQNNSSDNVDNKKDGI
jgi:hypothetical protein